MQNQSRPKPAGSVTIVIWILCMLLFVGIFSVSFMTSSDVRTTANLAREILATNLAESIACQVEARVNRHPWYQRFWLLEGQGRGTTEPGSGISASCAFDKSTTHVNLSFDTLPPSEYEFTALVKDVNQDTKMYRIYVEVTLQGEKFAFSWDKKYPESLLGAVNSDCSQVGKALEDPSGSASAADKFIEQVKTAAETPPAHAEEAQFQQTLTTLKNDNQIFVSADPIELTSDADVSGLTPPTAP